MTDRGLSTVVSYVLVLGIVAILTSTLIGAFAPFVTNQQQSAAQSTLKVLGNDLATDIETADRLAREAGTNGTVVLRTQLPTRVAGSTYDVAIAQVGSGTYEIRFRTTDFETNTAVSVRTQVRVQPRTGTAALDGGDLRIVYEPGPDELVVRRA